MSMTLNEANDLIGKLPDMKFKDRKRTVDRIERAGFEIKACNLTYSMVRLGVPKDVMEHILLEELTNEREPLIGDMIDNEQEANRLPVGAVLFEPSSGDVYRKTALTEFGYSYYEALGIECDVMGLEGFPLMLIWLPS